MSDPSPDPASGRHPGRRPGSTTDDPGTDDLIDATGAREPVVVLGRRTAFGRKNGVLGRLSPEALLAPVLAAVVADGAVPPDGIADVIIGNAVGGGGNVARLAALVAGLPDSVPGLTVDRQCGSGLEAIVLACRLVAAGAGNTYLAGGVESTSRAPLRASRPLDVDGNPDFYDRVRFSPDSLGDPDMGQAAENVAERFGILRARQDAFALRSHRLAAAAIDRGDFTEEIVPIDTDAGAVDSDEGPRRTLSESLMRRFPPAFRAQGTVTAGNSCADADGAVVVLVMSRELADARGITGYLRFLDAHVAGTDPNLPGIGGGEAARTLLERRGRGGGDIARIEFAEAFAAQVLASMDVIRVPEERANPQGGALALGHPFGASGALLVLRLLQQFRSEGPPGALGLSAISIAGGMGVSALWRWDAPA